MQPNFIPLISAILLWGAIEFLPTALAAPAVAEQPGPAAPAQLAPTNTEPTVLIAPVEAESQTNASDETSTFFDDHRNNLVVFGRNVTVEEGEKARDVFVFGGDAVVNGSVQNLIVVSGSATVNGEVLDDLVTVLGSATLGPAARVQGDATVVGGKLVTSPGATIEGERIELAFANDFLALPHLRAWLRHGLLLGRPLPPNVEWAWWIAGGMLLVCLFLATVFPKSLARSVDVLETRPGAAFFTGLLVLMLTGPFLLLLVISVVGILAIPFVLCGLIFALFFGKVAVYRFTGQQLARQLRLPGLELPLPSCFMGVAMFYLLYMIPFVGMLLWALATLLGIGVVSLAFFRALAPVNRRPPALIPSSAPPPTQGSPGATLDPLALPAPSADSLALLASSSETLPRAGFWIRLAATLLDAVMIGALMLPFHVTGITLIVWVAYHVGMWSWKGTTIGGIILGIKCVRTNGEKVSFAVALVRSLASFLSAIALFLGFLWAAWDREKQSWHDKIAGTVKVRVPRGISLV